jgi:hypothetical protein
MIEKADSAQQSLFEQLWDQSQKEGIGVVRLAVNSLLTDEERRAFFEGYAKFLTLNNHRTIEESSLQAKSAILEAIPKDNYPRFQNWARAMNPNALPLKPEATASLRARHPLFPRQLKG